MGVVPGETDGVGTGETLLPSSGRRRPGGICRYSRAAELAYGEPAGFLSNGLHFLSEVGNKVVYLGVRRVRS